MKTFIWTSLIGLFVGVMPGISYPAVSDPCNTSKVLSQIRPGATWVMQDDSMRHLKWLDKKQSKPSSVEVEKARQTCIAGAEKREALKAQARIELKDPNIPTDKKVNDLILLQDLDR